MKRATKSALPSPKTKPLELQNHASCLLKRGGFCVLHPSQISTPDVNAAKLSLFAGNLSLEKRTKSRRESQPPQRQRYNHLPDQQPRKRRHLYRQLIADSANLTVDIRPYRQEPRTIQRRPKNYQLLTKDHHLFKKIPHQEYHCRKPTKPS